ncbi:MAG: type II toxin-antitoxin system VapC family toxin [Nitrospirota bacterium]|nr:type II toxin-antitoxin system VapC family toxin [Nitrospirota bacterium]
MRFVLDNSVTMRWFFGDGKPEELEYAGKVLDALKQDSALVPVTWGLEVANVIARAESKGLVTEARSGSFLEMLEGVDIEVDAATFVHALSDTLQLARRYNLSAYDASYLELALRQGLVLATLDEDLKKAALKAGLKRFD